MTLLPERASSPVHGVMSLDSQSMLSKPVVHLQFHSSSLLSTPVLGAWYLLPSLHLLSEVLTFS